MFIITTALAILSFVLMIYAIISTNYDEHDVRTFFTCSIVFAAATMLAIQIESVHKDTIKFNEEIKEDLIRILDYELILFDELQEMPRVPATFTDSKYRSA